MQKTCAFLFSVLSCYKCFSEAFPVHYYISLSFGCSSSLLSLYSQCLKFPLTYHFCFASLIIHCNSADVSFSIHPRFPVSAIIRFRFNVRWITYHRQCSLIYYCHRHQNANIERTRECHSRSQITRISCYDYNVSCKCHTAQWIEHGADKAERPGFE